MTSIIYDFDAVRSRMPSAELAADDPHRRGAGDQRSPHPRAVP
jgi:hypothetical protein